MNNIINLNNSLSSTWIWTRFVPGEVRAARAVPWLVGGRWAIAGRRISYGQCLSSSKCTTRQYLADRVQKTVMYSGYNRQHHWVRSIVHLLLLMYLVPHFSLYVSLSLVFNFCAYLTIDSTLAWLLGESPNVSMIRSIGIHHLLPNMR